MSDCYENSYPLPPNSSFSRKRESRGEGWHQPHPNTSNDQVSFSYLGVPAPAGMSDCYESMSRTPIRDRPLQQPLIGDSRHPFVIPLNAGIQRGWGEGIVPRGLVPRLGRAASSPALHHPAPSHFHPLMRPSQGHGDSCESLPRTPIRGQESRGEGGGKTTANLW